LKKPFFFLSLSLSISLTPWMRAARFKKKATDPSSMVGHGGGRVASLVRVGGRNVGFDLRFPGDGYYPQEWAKRMLRDREPIPGARKKQKTRKRKEKKSTRR